MTMTQLPSYQFFMLPILEYLSDGKDHSMKEIRNHLIAQYDISEELSRAMLPSGPRIFDSRVGWAKTYLVQAGLVEMPKRAIVRITERGKTILSEHPQKIDLSMLERFPEFREFRARTRQRGENRVGDDATDSDSQTPEEKIDVACQAIRSELVRALLERLKTCDPSFFERLVIDLLVKMGYGNYLSAAGKATGGPGDEGVDGFINEDKLGLSSIYIQAKRWSGSVGRPEVQKFVGALHGKGTKKGVFLTTGSFTVDASEYVKRLTDLRVVLIDGLSLAEYMIDYNLGVTTRAVYEIKTVDSLWFDEDQ